MQQGYINLYRSFVDWEWHDDINTGWLFIHLLLTANYTDKDWQGLTIKRGSLVTSLDKLSALTGLSVRQVRTALNHLILTNEVTKSTTTKYTVISINNYEKYQTIDIVSDKQPTNSRQSDDKQPTTTKKGKQDKQDKKVKNNICAFEKFWVCYPKQKSKQAALKAFEKISPDDDLLSAMLSAIEIQKQSNDWQKDNGQFIPYPATWLNGRRWEDETEINKRDYQNDDLLPY